MNYAESVALFGMSHDGSVTVSGRLARFPRDRRTTIWLSISQDGSHYALAQDLPMTGFTGPTDVTGTFVEYMQPGRELAWFVRRGTAAERFRASVAFRASAHRDRHPPAGAGSLRVGFQAEFVSSHVPMVTSSGRTEVFGEISGFLEVPEAQIEFEGIGKWHEQMGQRPTFGPPFTYFSVQKPGLSILARSGIGRSWGFLVNDSDVIAIKDFQIEPTGEIRRFHVELVNGQRISGTAVTRWEESVPIEGRRRISAFVDVDSSVGRLMGQLNDWNPQDGDSGGRR